MNYQYIAFGQANAIGTITLNHPEKRNALSLNMIRELHTLLDDLKEQSDIKVVIVRGAGKIFSSGHDLSEMINRSLTDYREVFYTCSTFMQKIQDMPQPFIAQVHGIATAAGCQLVAACDLAVAEEGALFGTPGVRLGVFCTTPAIPVVRAVGRKRALEMLFTGRLVPAREAQQWGLVNRVVPLEKLEEETKALAEKIAEASPLTLQIGKQAFYAQVNLSDAQAYNLGNEVMISNLFAQDAREGISAFLEKRKPLWTGR
ncbi:MAG: enoyl-CoA hydratase [Deltaproteobacteria bacterium]|nr:enoyl-CoA hydratase [Deltaproteobacteria bacterium]